MTGNFTSVVPITASGYDSTVEVDQTSIALTSDGEQAAFTVTGVSVGDTTISFGVPAAEAATVASSVIKGGTLDVLTDDGTPLDSATKQSTGGFLAVNDDNDAYQFDDGGNPIPDYQTDGPIASEHNLLPLVLRSIPSSVGGYYTLSWTSSNIQLWMNEDKSPGVDAAGNEVTTIVSGETEFSASEETDVYVEGIAASDSLAAEEVALNWTPSPSTSTATGGSTGPRMPAKFDFVKLTVDDLQGPQNVPSYAKYTYSESGPFTLGTWSAAGGTVQGGQPEPFQTATSILWDGSDANNPTAGWVGKVFFTPIEGFKLERDVNVVQVTFSSVQRQPVTNQINYTNNLAHQSLQDKTAIYSTVQVPPPAGMWATIEVSSVIGPVINGQMRGVRFIELGFIQFGLVALQNDEYGMAPMLDAAGNVIPNKFGRRAISTLQASNVWVPDAVRGPNGTKPPYYDYYGDIPHVVFNLPEAEGGWNGAGNGDAEADNLIFLTSDGPYIKAAKAMSDGGFNATRFNILFNFHLYFSVRTTDKGNNADEVFSQRAMASWHTNLSGNVTPQGVWTSDAPANVNGGDDSFKIVTDGTVIQNASSRFVKPLNFLMADEDWNVVNTPQ